MSKTIFRGPMRRQIQEFMNFRKSLGFSLRNTAYVYAEFDRYLGKHHPTVKVITRTMVVNYLATTSHLHTTSRGYRVTLLRGFCRYRYQKDQRNYVPEPRIIPWGKRKLKPYIYKDEEIVLILQNMRRFKTRGPMIPETWVTMVALLAATGLRVGEAERLNIEDVDLKNGVLTIQRSKFFKSRLVPISDSVTTAMKGYRDLRLKHQPTNEAVDPFFIGMTGRRALAHEACRKFRQSVRELNLKTEAGGRPRLHDLRHTFATHSMDGIYRGGQDPSAQLPILATYLGHVNLDYTQTYLHPSTDLLTLAGGKFQTFSQTKSGVTS